MSILSSNPFGKMKGNVGKLNFREQDGQIIVSIRAAKVNVSNSDASVKNRKKFSFCSGPNQAIRRITVLYNLWKNFPCRGRYVCNKQNHKNLTLVRTYEDVGNIVLAPAERYTEITLQEIIPADPVFRVSVNPIPGSVHVGRYYASVQGIMILAVPRKASDAPYTSIPVTSAVLEIIQGQRQSFELEPPQWIALKEYEKVKLVLNLVIYDKMGNAVEVSGNLVGEFRF
jgi:hypothetical protein